ncbi:MAG: MipA/OmpV family protein [Opitutaceae bacterium]|nr:MipA/OmpV family protein [Opitutaceae bacterium]
MCKPQSLVFLVIGGILLALVPQRLPAQVQSPEQDSDPAWESRLGAAAMLRPVSPGVDKYRLMPLPFVEVVYRHRYFLSTERGLGATVVAANGFSADLALHFDLGRKEDWAETELRGLGDIGAAPVAAATLRYRNGGYTVAVKGRRALGSYDGLRGESTLARQWRTGSGLVLTLESYLAWADSATMAAFYGVDAAQSLRSGRAGYRPGAGLERWGGRLRLMRQIGARWGVAATLDYGVLLGDARRSPLTSEDNQLVQAALAVFFRF